MWTILSEDITSVVRAYELKVAAEGRTFLRQYDSYCCSMDKCGLWSTEYPRHTFRAHLVVA